MREVSVRQIVKKVLFTVILNPSAVIADRGEESPYCQVNSASNPLLYGI